MITDHGDGTYSVRLYSYEREAWQNIIVDNRLPVQNGDLVMCSMTAQCAIWPCILQKAGAIYTGSYRNADGACPIFAMGMLTGCSDLVYLDPAEDDEPFGTWAMCDLHSTCIDLTTIYYTPSLPFPAAASLSDRPSATDHFPSPRSFSPSLCTAHAAFARSSPLASPLSNICCTWQVPPAALIIRQPSRIR